MQMEEMMDLVQAGAVQAIDLRQKQEELRETDQNYIQVLHCQPVKHSSKVISVLSGHMSSRSGYLL